MENEIYSEVLITLDEDKITQRSLIVYLTKESNGYGLFIQHPLMYNKKTLMEMIYTNKNTAIKIAVKFAEEVKREFAPLYEYINSAYFEEVYRNLFYKALKEFYDIALKKWE